MAAIHWNGSERNENARTRREGRYPQEQIFNLSLSFLAIHYLTQEG
jgi:hypothetical protein